MREWVRSKWVAVLVIAVVVALSSWLAIESRDGPSGAESERAESGDSAGQDGRQSSTEGGDGTPPSGRDRDPGGPTDDHGVPAGEFVVRLSQFWFEGATVPAGVTFTVYNDMTPPQTFTAVDGSFDSGQLRSTESKELIAPAQPGTYSVMSNAEFGSSFRAELVVT